jgi:hypothetical protein
MKRIFSILTAILLLSAAVFAEDNYDDKDEYDDGYVYEQNGEGDQFLKIDLGANFPLNFGSQLKIGGLVSIGYYRFLNQYLAVGGDLVIGYNVSIGNKPLFEVPVAFGVMYQPYVGKFEFPLMLNIGFATVTCQSMTYFPAFTAKFTGGAYYRFNETWSFGISTTTYWIPQWFSIGRPNSSDNTRGHAIDNGFFTSACLSVRYHF